MVRDVPSMERPLPSETVTALSEKTTDVPAVPLCAAKADGAAGSSTASDRSTAAARSTHFFGFIWFILSARAAGAQGAAFI